MAKKQKAETQTQAPKMVKYAGRMHRPGSRYFAAIKLMEQNADSDYNTCLQALLGLGLAQSTARNWVKQIRNELGLEAAAKADAAE